VAPIIEGCARVFVQQAQRVSGIDPEMWDHFGDWARTNHPDQAREITFRHYHYADVSGYRRLAQEYLASGDAFDLTTS
jgi:hypothetical protein